VTEDVVVAVAVTFDDVVVMIAIMEAVELCGIKGEEIDDGTQNDSNRHIRMGKQAGRQTKTRQEALFEDISYPTNRGDETSKSSLAELVNVNLD
jgi:hypothetical protein